MNKLFANYPAKLAVPMTDDVAREKSNGVGTAYELQNNFYAILGDVPNQCKAAILTAIEEGKTTICTGKPDALPSSLSPKTVAPVYALVPNGPLAVPTGRILVRFQNAIKASSQEKELQALGYIIDQELGYAPHARWVRDENGDSAQALNNIRFLTNLPYIEHIEPQMLMPAMNKS